MYQEQYHVTLLLTSALVIICEVCYPRQCYLGLDTVMMNEANQMPSREEDYAVKGSNQCLPSLEYDNVKA